jgi:hypothetical protein
MLDRYEFVRGDEELRQKFAASIFAFLDGYVSAILASYESFRDS